MQKEASILNKQICALIFGLLTASDIIFWHLAGSRRSLFCLHWKKKPTLLFALPHWGRPVELGQLELFSPLIHEAA